MPSPKIAEPPIALRRAHAGVAMLLLAPFVRKQGCPMDASTPDASKVFHDVFAATICHSAASAASGTGSVDTRKLAATAALGAAATAVLKKFGSLSHDTVDRRTGSTSATGGAAFFVTTLRTPPRGGRAM